MDAAGVLVACSQEPIVAAWRRPSICGAMPLPVEVLLCDNDTTDGRCHLSAVLDELTLLWGVGRSYLGVPPHGPGKSGGPRSLDKVFEKEPVPCGCSSARHP